jgi:cysteinyl-tRNA synthetase
VPYRNKLNFTFEGLKAAATSIDRLRSFQLRLDSERFPAGDNEALDRRTTEALERFESSLDDDLNTAEALAAIFEFIRETNSAMDAGEFKAGNLAKARGLFERFDSIFEVLKPSVEEGGISESEIEELIAERNQARKARNFKRGDEIRAELLERGVVLEDTKEGVRWKRK